MLRSAIIRLAAARPDLRAHLLPILASSAAEELVEAFWSEGFSNEKIQVIHMDSELADWQGGPIGGYGHGDNWTPTEYAEAEVEVKYPNVVQFTGRVVLTGDFVVSPAMVESILEGAIRKDGPEIFLGDLEVGSFCAERIKLERDWSLQRNKYRRSNPFSIEKCEPRVQVRETRSGLDIEVDVKLTMKLDTSELELDPPEPDFNPPEPDDYYDSRYEP